MMLQDLQQQRAAEIEELDDQLRKTLAEIDRLRKDVAAFEASILQVIFDDIHFHSAQFIFVAVKMRKLLQ